MPGDRSASSSTSQIDATSVKARLEERKVPQMFFLVGDENFYKEIALEAVVSRLRREGEDVKGIALEALVSRLGREGKDVEVIRCSLPDLRPGELESECATPLLFAKSKAVFVEKADDLLVDAEGKTSGIHLERILSRISPNVFLLLSLGKKARIPRVKGLAGRAIEVSCTKVYERDVPGWVKGRLSAEFGKSLSTKAAFMLAEQAGQNLTELEMQLEKLALYAGDRKEVVEADVAALAADVREFARYEMGDALGSKDRDRAMRTVKDATSKGVEPSAVLTLIASHFRRVLQAKRIASKGGQKAVASELGVIPFVAGLLVRQSEKFTEAELEHKLSEILKAQGELRSGGSDESLLHALVLKLCAG